MKIVSDTVYDYVVGDILDHELVLSMQDYIQHGGTNCYDHSLEVSYKSYMICKHLGLDYRSAARGGLLHDFFLYDWHDKQYKWHGLRHPLVALENANRHFDLNSKEKEIIKKHMWPITLILPIHIETYIVSLVDKYCTCLEILRYGRQLIARLIQA